MRINTNDNFNDEKLNEIFDQMGRKKRTKKTVTNKAKSEEQKSLQPLPEPLQYFSLGIPIKSTYLTFYFLLKLPFMACLT